jgi:hypothetical protein
MEWLLQDFKRHAPVWRFNDDNISVMRVRRVDSNSHIGALQRVDEVIRPAALGEDGHANVLACW